MKNVNVVGLVCFAVFEFLLIMAFTGKGRFAAQRPTGRRERVELVTWRTELPHQGCPSNGAWVASGQPRKIEAYGIDKGVWPHRCSGCGATNEVYDATWPKFEREWRAVE